MSQFARDARIAMIYEGANGMQALDLVGRKLAQDGGKHVMAFFEMVKAFARRTRRRAAEGRVPRPAEGRVQGPAGGGDVLHAERHEEPQRGAGGVYDFMHMMGHVCLGLMWARMAKAAYAALDAGRRPRLLRGQDRHGALLHGPPAARLRDAPCPDRDGAEPVMALAAEAF
jgi:hypothetical protein